MIFRSGIKEMKLLTKIILDEDISVADFRSRHSSILKKGEGSIKLMNVESYYDGLVYTEADQYV